MFTLAISFDHFQFHGPNIPDSYEILLFYSTGLYFHHESSTIGCCFCFGSVSSFFLELFLHWFLVACWAPTDLGSSSFSVLSFCLFILFTGFLRQEYWSGYLLGASVGNPARGKFMRKGAWQKAKTGSGLRSPPWVFSSIYPQNQNLTALLYYAFHQLLWH